MKKALCALAVLSLLAAAPADAQNRRASGEAGIDVGYVWFDADVDDDFFLGAHIGINATDHVEIEALYRRVDTELDGYDAGVDVDLLALGWIWNVHPNADIDNPHVPYFTFGIGTADYDVEVAHVSEDYDFVFIGGGYRYFWREYFGLRWDFRALFSGDDGDLGDAFSADNHEIMTSFGLTWVFGK